VQDFKKLTEQEKRERGDNTVSLYEPFAVLRERLATAVNISTFFGPFFRAAKESTEKPRAKRDRKREAISYGVRR